AIGAEYGEGFETFRSDGLLKVDVDFLNEKLQEGFLKRIRYAMKPDEAYGLVFSWDNVVSDTQTLKLKAWEQLASEEAEQPAELVLHPSKEGAGVASWTLAIEVFLGPRYEFSRKEIPGDGDGDAQRLLLYAGADHVLHKILLWEKEGSELDRLTSRLSQLYYENLLKLSEPMDGLHQWLDAVYRSHIPCAVVSSLDRINMVEALERMGLRKYFQAIVSEEDGMESIAHKFLSAAVKLDRKPSKCVVFEDDPRGVTAAHNCTMMAVGLIGAHPAYVPESVTWYVLGQADLAVASFNELSVINLRRLFAHKGSNFMDMQKQIIEKTPPRRKLTIDTIF
ncbi:hypothetical protein C3L33_16550, partial [Rhododendron williamsianum]